MFTSFMGKGATKDAALSLSHLLYITSQISINKVMFYEVHVHVQMIYDI